MSSAEHIPAKLPAYTAALGWPAKRFGKGITEPINPVAAAAGTSGTAQWLCKIKQLKQPDRKARYLTTKNNHSALG